VPGIAAYAAFGNCKISAVVVAGKEAGERKEKALSTCDGQRGFAEVERRYEVLCCACCDMVYWEFRELGPLDDRTIFAAVFQWQHDS